MTRKALVALFLIAALAGCSDQSNGGAATGSAQNTADGITKAAYNDDYAGVSANFDDAVKRTVGRAEVGAMSDKMHKLGDYTGLTLLASNPAKNEFTYRAAFSHGTMNVGLRLDPDGKVAAYRIFLPAQ